MDFHATEYYRAFMESDPDGHFHHVIPLHEEPQIDWSDAKKMAPGMCLGWYELAQLPLQDRIEFTRDFWLSKLPYRPDLEEGITRFFSSLDDLGVFLTQQHYEDPYIAHLVYSLADNSGFFHGESPAAEAEIIRLQKEFSSFTLPSDYLSFFQIHNGFAKQTDTGVIPLRKLKERFDAFQFVTRQSDEPLRNKRGGEVDPQTLFPFYESFGMPFFQCFWSDWYPDQEMGNVYLSPSIKRIVTCEERSESAETLAFQTFSDWLMFYIEKID